MSGDRLSDLILGARMGGVDSPRMADAIRAALASGDLSPGDLGMVELNFTSGGHDLYHAPIPSAPEPGSSDTSREAPAPSPRCAPSPGTSDGPRPVDAIRAALADGTLTPEDLGMEFHDECTLSACEGAADPHHPLYRIPSAPEPGSSDTSREAPAPSPRCAPSPGTSDGPRPVAEAP